MPLRHFDAELRALYRDPPSRSTMERLAKRLGDSIRAALPTVDDLARDERMPAEAAAISIGLDRTCAPMAEPRAVDAPATPRRRRDRAYCRRPPAPIDVNYRMPHVGTLAVHDRHGEVLTTKRVAATAGEGPAGLLQRLFDEVEAAKRGRRSLPLVVVQDGAPELWTLVGDACRTRGLRPEVEMSDRYHLDERLAVMAEAICGSSRHREPLRRRWSAQLDASDSAIARIRRELRALCCGGCQGCCRVQSCGRRFRRLRVQDHRADRRPVAHVAAPSFRV